MFGNKERRFTTRYGAARVIALMHCHGVAEAYRHANQVKLVDINMRGLAFISKTLLDLGTEVEFGLRLDEVDVDSIKGTIKSAIPAGSETRYGVIFDDSSESVVDENLQEIERRLGRSHEDKKSNARRRIRRK